jgi:DNA-binding LacI/PurR family transcriptional regulator
MWSISTMTRWRSAVWPIVPRGDSGSRKIWALSAGGMEAASILPRRPATTVVPTTQFGKVAAEALLARLKGCAGLDMTVAPTRLVPGETA